MVVSVLMVPMSNECIVAVFFFGSPIHQWLFLKKNVHCQHKLKHVNTLSRREKDRAVFFFFFFAPLLPPGNKEADGRHYRLAW